jgi:SsrA-binding protein
MENSILIQNKKAGRDYEFIEKYEAGIELHGFEVKALRAKKGRLEGAHITLRGGEAFLLNFQLTPYQAPNTPESYNPERPRRLLLTKKEISRLTGLERQKGLTIIPLTVYNKGSLIKLEIAVAKGKKKRDKRETIKKRDTEREIRRDLKRRI